MNIDRLGVIRQRRIRLRDNALQVLHLVENAGHGLRGARVCFVHEANGLGALAAKIFNVSERSVYTARRIRRLVEAQDRPDIAAAIQAGRMSLNEALAHPRSPAQASARPLNCAPTGTGIRQSSRTCCVPL